MGKDDPIEFIDGLILAHEADVEEILSNCLWHLTEGTEGKSTIRASDLKRRIRNALIRIRGQVVDEEIDALLEDVWVKGEGER